MTWTEKTYFNIYKLRYSLFITILSPMKRTSISGTGGPSKYHNSPNFSCQCQVLSVWHVKFKYWINFFASLIQEMKIRDMRRNFTKINTTDLKLSHYLCRQLGRRWVKSYTTKLNCLQDHTQAAFHLLDTKIER